MPVSAKTSKKKTTVSALIFTLIKSALYSRFYFTMMLYIFNSLQYYLLYNNNKIANVHEILELHTNG